MRFLSSILTTLLLAAPLTNARRDFKPGGKVDIQIYFFSNEKCQSANVAKKEETSNSNNPLEDPAIAYTLSRDLREDENLDFSAWDKGDSCGKYLFSAVGKRREGNKCFKMDEHFRCWRLWTVKEAKELGTTWTWLIDRDTSGTLPAPPEDEKED